MKIPKTTKIFLTNNVAMIIHELYKAKKEPENF